jgi:hypothetical protein
MNYLRELLKDYKNEVKEILAADKVLATEIQVRKAFSDFFRVATRTVAMELYVCHEWGTTMRRNFVFKTK